MGTHRVTIELADASYQVLRRAVDSGQYASESAAVEEVIISGLCLEPAPQEGPEFERWLREEVLAADDELEADLSSGLTPEQLR
jgi:hypothetical protein